MRNIGDKTSSAKMMVDPEEGDMDWLDTLLSKLSPGEKAYVCEKLSTEDSVPLEDEGAESGGEMIPMMDGPDMMEED